MNSTASCPQCGRLLPSDAPSGLCPQCLLGIGMQTTSRAEGPDRTGSFTPPKPEQLARHFPHLEILDLIGHGGMGAVYKARQRGLDRLVALKILPPEVEKDPSFAVRFSREARALAKLNHPHIVGVHDSGNAGGLYYLLMEYVDGVNLREAIQTKELTPAEALAIVPQICEALQYAHDEGVVHRDIKPENILLDKKGRVKIADFGVARLLGHAPDNFTLTGTHQLMGTPRYMAPEQLEGSHEIDHRADLYSLGVVFYEMLTGELPLGRFDAPSHKVELDVRVDEVVLRTLEKEPSRRYQQASEIKTDVESISGMTGAPPHLRRTYGCEYDRPAPQNASRAGCLIAALVLLLMTGGCLLLGAVVLWFSYTAQRVEVSRAESQEQEARQQSKDAERTFQEKSDAGHWELKEVGPVLNLQGQQNFRLRESQTPLVNRILQSIYHQYLEVEQRHTSRETDELGHLVITIREFPEPELAKLEASLWTQLDEVLDADQQGLMRFNLAVHAGEGIARFTSQRWKPGILGWGRGGAHIELWKLGTWFHWKARVEIESESLSIFPAGRAPELPAEFARFWVDEIEPDAKHTPAEPTIDSKPTESPE